MKIKIAFILFVLLIPLSAIGQTTEWNLEFPTSKSERPAFYSLSLIINGTNITGFYVVTDSSQYSLTGGSKHELTGKIENNQVYLEIPRVVNYLGIRLEGAMTNNNLIKGTKVLYISDTKRWTKKDSLVNGELGPSQLFIATKK